jgi:MFS superfamily sulfate permease-like transporter
MKSNPLKTLGQDLPASVVVFLVALPLCIGVAVASGAPAISGLVAGIAGGIVVGAISGSQLSVSGPAAGLTAIVAGALAHLPSFEFFLISVIICGVLQVMLGYLKAGIIGEFIPNAVIKGMLAAIGIILILKQLPHLVGFDKLMAKTPFQKFSCL